jgi:hypothetical protein
MPEPAPQCPLHRKPMTRLDVPEDTDYQCSKKGCIVHWNPEIPLFYLKIKGDPPTKELHGRLT